MRTDLTQSQTSVEGSIRDAAKRQGQPLENVLAEVETIVYIDASYSMDEPTDRSGKTKYHLAKDALSDVQKAFPGKVLIIAFDSEAEICLDGIPHLPRGGTAMDKGLELGLPFDGTGVKHIVISDGEPNNEFAALNVADQMEDPINTIFIGRESDHLAIDFMKRLTRNGGRSAGRVEPEMLGETTIKLLTGR